MSVYAGHNCAAHPGDLQGWNSYSPVFGTLIKELRPGLIIEVGTWKGASSIHMGKLCRELGVATRIICVDTWLGTGDETYGESSLRRKNGYPQVYYTFLTNVIEAGLEEMIEPLPLPSTQAAEGLARHGVRADLIYIDGDHSFRGVSDDLANYWPLLRPGGVMMGDDYDTEHPGLTAAVGKFFPPQMIERRDGKFLVKKPAVL